MPKTAESRTIADRYKLIRALGRGGMGVVWLAEDTLLKRQVAVKEIEFPAELDSEDTASVKARAMREARSAAGLSHPRVVTIFDVIQADEGAFIVMEYVEAPTLSELVKSEGPLADDRAGRIGLDIFEALTVAHAKGIVHRDVKPGNVMVTEDGAKLADFGIASVKDDPKITSTGMVLGSPQFMAPEQARGSGSDPRTDFWSLGATLYYALEGDLPFDRGQPIATLSAVINDEPHRMRSGGALAGVVSALLSKEPERRPSGQQLRAMLEDAAAGAAPRLPVEVTTKPYQGPTTERGEQPITPTPVPPPRPQRMPEDTTRRRRAFGVIAAVLALVIAIAVGAFMLANDDENPTPAADSQQPEDRDSRERSGGGGGTDAGGSTTEQPGAPAGWSEYVDPASGHRIAHPADWEIVENSVDDSSTDFRDPETGTYLRVDWTDAPGPDPVAAWEEQADGFGSRHANYEEIRIEPTTFQGYEAAIWEFTYSEGGANLRALDLGFVTDNYGFALLFQTHEEDWDESQELFDQLKESFQAPPGE
ncbi:MAG: serine/threonine-protein kinase [Actinomycetota bacterium]